MLLTYPFTHNASYNTLGPEEHSKPRRVLIRTLTWRMHRLSHSSYYSSEPTSRRSHGARSPAGSSKNAQSYSLIALLFRTRSRSELRPSRIVFMLDRAISCFQTVRIAMTYVTRCRVGENAVLKFTSSRRLKEVMVLANLVPKALKWKRKRKRWNCDGKTQALHHTVRIPNLTSIVQETLVDVSNSIE